MVDNRRPKCPACFGEKKILAPFVDEKLYDECPACDGTGYDNTFMGAAKEVEFDGCGDD